MYRGSSEGHFTDYLEALAGSSEPPPNQRVEAVLVALWRLIQAELRRRGLWLRQPGYLGVYGASSWSHVSRHADLFHSEAWELVAECFRYIFLDRYAYLARQLEAGANVEGLVRRNVRNFVHDTQKKHDPLGFRVFSVLRKAVTTLVDEGTLFVLDGDERPRGITLLGFDPASDGPTRDEEETVRTRLEQLAPVWTQRLLPELLTAHGRGLVALQDEVRTLVRELPQSDVQMFRFRDLVNPIKQDVRQRWGALFDNEQGETALEEDLEPGLVKMVRQVQPDTTLEEREAFAHLLHCVEHHLAAAELRKKTRAYLQKLWQFLSLYALQPETTDIPSHRALAQHLDIPRNTMSSLFDHLRELTQLCQEHSGSTSPAVSSTPASAETQTKTAALAALAATAQQRHQLYVSNRAETKRDAARSLQSGDLLQWASSARRGIDWLFLDPDVAPFTAWLVPVDTTPLYAPTDVDVPVEAGGPWTLRCAQALRLASRQISDLDFLQRHGSLSADHVQLAEAALQRWLQSDQGDEGEFESSDPEHEVWLEESVAPARVELEQRLQQGATVHAFPSEPRQPAPPQQATPGQPTPASHASQPSPHQWWARAAAVLLATTLGLTGALFWQQGRLDDFASRQGATDTPGIKSLTRVDLALPTTTRDLEDTIEIPVRKAANVALSIQVTAPDAPYRVDLLDTEGDLLLRLPLTSDRHSQLLIQLDGVQLGNRLQLKLYDARQGKVVRIATYDLLLVNSSVD